MRALLSCLLFCAAPVLASGPGEGHTDGTAYLANGSLTYAVFERAVPHVDLEACPAEFDSEANFCRLSLNAEQAHVFVFSLSDLQPLLAVKSYDLSDGFLPF